MAVSGNGSYIYYWKSKGLSEERIDSIKTSDYGITSYLSYYDSNKIRVKFDGACLKQDPGSPFHGGIVNVYIVHEISKNINITNYPTQGQHNTSLFGAVKLTKTADINKYGYSGHGIGFENLEVFHFLALD